MTLSQLPTSSDPELWPTHDRLSWSSRPHSSRAYRPRAQSPLSWRYQIIRLLHGSLHARPCPTFDRRERPVVHLAVLQSPDSSLCSGKSRLERRPVRPLRRSSSPRRKGASITSHATKPSHSFASSSPEATSIPTGNHQQYPVLERARRSISSVLDVPGSFTALVICSTSPNLSRCSSSSARSSPSSARSLSRLGSSSPAKTRTIG
ncbi:hypothetical protein V8E36_004449 [Tilletia maclaganii]